MAGPRLYGTQPLTVPRLSSGELSLYLVCRTRATRSDGGGMSNNGWAWPKPKKVAGHTSAIASLAFWGDMQVGHFGVILTTSCFLYRKLSGSKPVRKVLADSNSADSLPRGYNLS